MTSQIQKRTNALSYMITYQMVMVMFLFLYNYYFFHDGSVTHTCAHTCTQTQTCCRPRLEGSVGTRYDLIRMRHAGSAIFENPTVEDR